MAEINYKKLGLTRCEALCALYNASHPHGLGFLHFDKNPLTYKEATVLLKKTDYIDYLKGRVIKTAFISGKDTIDTRLYDRDNGEDAALHALKAYKPKKANILYKIKRLWWKAFK